MKKVTLLGIDLAKNIFQLHGVDEHGKVVLRRKLRRAELLEFLAQLPSCTIAMEACGGANYWAQEIRKLGHCAKLISPQFVKPYRKSNKNDYNDAEAICEALSRPSMRFVAIKAPAQQDIQSIHRVRSGIIKSRTALANNVRGLLMEYGIVIPKQIAQLRKALPGVLENVDGRLSPLMLEVMQKQYEALRNYDSQVKFYDDKIQLIFSGNQVCQRIAKIEGIGPVAATALCYSVADPSLFRSGREFAAFLGLVPRQDSSGGRTMLLGIHKRGDTYLRTLLVHGARAALRVMPNKTDSKSQWAMRIRKERGHNKACVALANKNARQIWAVLTKNEEYRRAA